MTLPLRVPAPLAPPTPPPPAPPSSERSITELLAAVRDPARLGLVQISARLLALRDEQVEARLAHDRLRALARGGSRRDLKALASTLRTDDLRPERSTVGPGAFDYPRLRRALGGLPIEDVPLVLELLERLHEERLLRPLPESPGPVEVCRCGRPWGQVFVERCPERGHGCLRREAGFQHLACGKPVKVLDRGVDTPPPSTCPACKAQTVPHDWQLTERVTRCLRCERSVQPFPSVGGASLDPLPCPCGVPSAGPTVAHIYAYEPANDATTDDDES